jgi:hypothetical protein
VVTAGQIDIRPESLATAGQTLAHLAEEMAGAVTQLESAVTGSGNPWGNDETGTLFSGIYNAVLGHTLESLGTYVEQVGYAAAALARQAQETAAADSTAAANITRAGG